MHEALTPPSAQPKPLAPSARGVFRLHAAYLRDHPDPVAVGRLPNSVESRLPALRSGPVSILDLPRNG